MYTEMFKLHTFNDWLLEHYMTTAEAALFFDMSPSAIHKLRYGAIPIITTMQKIYVRTEGAVDGNVFYRLHRGLITAAVREQKAPSLVPNRQFIMI